MESLTPEKLAEFAVWFVVFLFSTTLHEAGHALFARLGGDDTAYRGGQVTLNPLPHIQREPFGMVLLPIISFFLLNGMIGWASTPYDPHWAARHPRRQAMMSAAGPAGNLLLVVVAFVALVAMVSQGVLVAPDRPGFSHLAEPAARYGPDSILHAVAMTLSVGLSLNLLLFIFNLLPLPPLDGAGVVHGLFPATAGRFIDLLRGNPMMSLVGLVIAWQLIPTIFRPAWRIALELLHPGVYVVM